MGYVTDTLIVNLWMDAGQMEQIEKRFTYMADSFNCNSLFYFTDFNLFLWHVEQGDKYASLFRTIAIKRGLRTFFQLEISAPIISPLR